MKVIKRSLAVKDIIETADYIARDDLEVAYRFLDAVEATIEKLKVTPKIGTLQTSKGQGNLRMWFVDGFPKSLIFYIATKDEIEIVKVIHSARDYYRIFGD